MPKAVSTDYQSRVRKPDDFDAFWEDVLRQAAVIPLEAEVVPDPLRTSNDVEVFEVFYTSLDHVRIASWYCRPARRAERSPAIMFLPGYQMDPPIPKEWARKGYNRSLRRAAGQASEQSSVQPRVPQSADAQHRRSAHVRLPRLLCGRLARRRLSAVAL